MQLHVYVLYQMSFAGRGKVDVIQSRGFIKMLCTCVTVDLART